MLAYVFWHWPHAGVERGDYERLLRAFHRALAASAPPGFWRSFVLRQESGPGLAGAAGYADWYLVADGPALDALERAAVSGACRAPHDEVAHLAAGGTAALYRRREGTPDLAAARCAVWLTKPAGTSYDEFFARLRPLATAPDRSLWQRRLTLGPGPEFCLLSPERLELPPSLAAAAASVESIPI